jgi:glutathione S-transferase
VDGLERRRVDWQPEEGGIVIGGLIVLVLVGAVAWYLWERSRRRTRPMSGGLHTEIELPHEREFELYHNALSLCSKKTRVCLAELGIEYESHPIDLIETGSYENISRHFLAVNPAGLVPVLVHNGHPIYESHDQIRYAAEHSPRGTAALLPEDPELEKRMQEWVDRTSLTGDDPTAETRSSAGNCVPGLTFPLFAAMIEDIPVHRVLEGLLFHRIKFRPVIFLTLKAVGVRRLSRLQAGIRLLHRSIRHMREHLDALEAQLVASGGPWILGSQFTLADVGWVPIFERLVEADCLHVFVAEGRRPAVAAYWERLKERPSYRAAIAEHTHPTVTRGTARLRAAKQADPELRRALESA